MAEDFKAKFSAGDIVTLKGGGPRMTVAVTDTPNASGVYCVWFEQHHLTGLWGGPFRESFNKDALEPAPAKAD